MMNQAQADTMETDGCRSHAGFLHRLLGIRRDENPPNEILTFEQNLEELHLLEANQLLIQREECLFGDVTEAESLQNPEEDIEKLAADRRKLQEMILETLLQNLFLSPEEVNAETLTSALKIICQEEKQDQLWKQRRQTPPAWRPCGWKHLHDSMLCRLVKERMDKPSTTHDDQVDQTSVRDNILSMGRQLKEDLLWVVYGLKMYYPSEMDICNFFVKIYHQTFSARVRELSDLSLEDKDCTFLLRWVNDFYPELLKKLERDSEINIEALGKLLPEESLKRLEEKYLNKRQCELMTYISDILKEVKQKWSNGEELKREFGCYVSPVAYDIIQLISGMVTSAEKVVGDLRKAQSITSPLSGFMERFRRFQDDIIKQNRVDSKAYVKANLSCVKQFRDVLVNNSHLFTEEVQENCLCIVTTMKQCAHMYLLGPVHKALKPQYRKLGTDDWLNKSAFDSLLVSIETELQDLKGVTESCHQELICQFHQEVAVEYVRRLLKGHVKLKDRDQQHQAYMIMKDNAESLHNLFSQKGSKEDWLKEILTKIAEVLKLQDLPAIQMQVVSLGSAFPDIREKHVSALLKLKTHISKANRKTVEKTLNDTLREIDVADTCPFFSKVQVR